MGKESPKRRRFKIRQKQKRREKIKKLKERLKKAQTKEERQRIIDKILRIVPHYWEFLEGFLKSPEKEKEGTKA
jgi:uncharacterized protein YpuA (DUF1002 family)